MKSPETLRRMEELRVRLEKLPFVKKVTSLADYVKRVNRELHSGDPAQAVVPASAEAIAQELFVFERTGLTPEGRVSGRFRATGIRPKVSDKIASTGVQLPMTMFEHVKMVA